MGVRRQEEDCRRLAALREWDVVEAYVDNDRSAWNGKPRPSFERLLADIEARRVDAVIVYQSSRLTRKPTELEAFIDLHKRTGVRLITTNGDIDLASATGRFVARIHGAQAAAESDQISERVRRALREAAELGQPHGGLRPYGFMPDRKTHDPHEAAILRESADSLLAGDPMRSVTRRLNDRSEQTSAGCRWRPEVLRKMLLSPRIVGIRAHAGRFYTASWEPIISPDVQTQLKAILCDPARQSRSGRPATHLLSGILRCGQCGKGMQWLPAGGRNKPAYICRARADGGCGGCSITAKYVESYVEWAALQIADRDQIAESPSVDTSGIRDRLRQLSEAFAREDITWDEFMSAKHVIDQRLSAAATTNARVASAGRIRDRWEGMSVADRRDAIRSLVGSIVITKGLAHTFDPDRIKIDTFIRPGTWSFPVRGTP